MNGDEHRFNDQEITERIIGCAFQVANTLGHGFLEKVYENALAHEIRKCGYSAEQQFPVPVVYDDLVVGDFYVDILVEQKVIVELKAVEKLNNVHMAQCLNYLRATGLRTCLLLNFARAKVEVKRVSL